MITRVINYNYYTYNHMHAFYEKITKSVISYVVGRKSITIITVRIRIIVSVILLPKMQRLTLNVVLKKIVPNNRAPVSLVRSEQEHS